MLIYFIICIITYINKLCMELNNYVILMTCDTSEWLTQDVIYNYFTLGKPKKEKKKGNQNNTNKPKRVTPHLFC